MKKKILILILAAFILDAVFVLFINRVVIHDRIRDGISRNYNITSAKVKKFFCEFKGGEIQHLYSGTAICNKLTPDFGKECTDSSQCSSMCVTVKHPRPYKGEITTGECSKFQQVRSHQEVIKGIAGDAFEVD